MSRFGYVMLTYIVTLGVIIAALIGAPIRFIWNASASVPIGLYTISRSRDLTIGDIVAIRPDPPLADMMVARGYIARDVPLMKHVAAVGGQQVCRHGTAITVDHKALGEALTRDRRGRSLPVWQGCRTLRANQIFAMNPAVPDSLDGRYFGPLPIRSVLGKATALYTDPANDGRFVWRATDRQPAR